MLDCPKCGIAAYDGTACGACRFTATGKKAARVMDPMHGICEFIDQGQRCAAPGAISPGLRGDGPWYCWPHFSAVILGRTLDSKPPGPPSSGFQRLKNLLRRALPREPGQDDEEERP